MKNVKPEIRILTPILLSQLIRYAFTVGRDMLQDSDELQPAGPFLFPWLLEPTRPTH